ncbi:6-phosphogluconate dehydratase [Actinopolyspora lacussalsi subsp. righensis]|uniref:Phosphogluconate dehydratase n=1 Tax=Actinopolyspora righensis TaxID=995060 RepID=A0A1I7AVF1_9ACTN|nr:phosphogluconate dehydratase [Actinopolyspora righensis]SFT78919.1 6-phosphogluconate dehydratase [Actinopolyspora righensis]
MTPTSVHPVVREVTERIAERSSATRREYLERIRAAKRTEPARANMACSNLAHGFAAISGTDRESVKGLVRPGVAIVSAYNDMLSAHKPYAEFPDWIKEAARHEGGVAQFAGGVPAMCDGITQGRDGMELSMFSRDVIAMATGVALSHEMFDSALLLGICDKIVPGLLIGGLTFGHLPITLVPAGPMPSGLPNGEKSRIRQLFAEGKATREELLEAESASYHSPGTCTFYGTANSNQLVVEMMGLHLPGSTFVPPGTPLRRALTEEAARNAVRAAKSEEAPSIGEIIDERAIVNGVVALLATGGSTNHTMHLPAVASAAGIQLTWDDFSDLSSVVPLLGSVYPNGSADINHFTAAGGVQTLVSELLEAGLVHPDVRTVAGDGLERYRQQPFLEDGELIWREGPARSLDTSVLRGVSEPFDTEGGLRVLEGNLGRSVMKVSAVKQQHRSVTAQARIFDDQEQFKAAFQADELNRDVVVVVRNQGPQANGMPELHGLSPGLGVLQDRGYQVALVTDGRMSGASGKIPSAIQVTPEASAGGRLARLRDGDVLRVDGEQGTLEALVPDDELAAREPAAPTALHQFGTGRELFATFRQAVGRADQGASVFPTPEQQTQAQQQSRDEISA